MCECSPDYQELDCRLRSLERRVCAAEDVEEYVARHAAMEFAIRIESKPEDVVGVAESILRFLWDE